eukprot:g22412.t1
MSSSSFTLSSFSSSSSCLSLCPSESPLSSLKTNFPDSQASSPLRQRLMRLVDVQEKQVLSLLEDSQKQLRLKQEQVDVLMAAATTPSGKRLPWVWRCPSIGFTLFSIVLLSVSASAGLFGSQFSPQKLPSPALHTWSKVCPETVSYVPDPSSEEASFLVPALSPSLQNWKSIGDACLTLFHFGHLQPTLAANNITSRLDVSSVAQSWRETFQVVRRFLCQFFAPALWNPFQFDR